MLTFLILALAALQIADWHTTRTILAKGGHEQNPVAKWCISKVGIDGFLIAKGVFVVAASYWLGTESELMLYPLVAFYCWIIRHNYKSMPKRSAR